MYITRHIDWLSCTISQSVNPREIFPLLDWRYTGVGHHGYRARYECRRTGVDCETDSATSDMGSHFRFTGDALSALRDQQGATDDGLVRQLVRVGGKASRIDLTINIHDGLLTPAIVFAATKKGSLHAKASSYRFIAGKNGNVEGDTLYIGAPTSDRQFRCYNKAAEAGAVARGSWVRLELELRRVLANAAFKTTAANDVDSTVVGHMGDFIDWQQHEYTRALSGKSVPVEEVARRVSNRRKWLLGQVAQALAKEMLFDDEFANQFWQHVQENYRTLDKG